MLFAKFQRVLCSMAQPTSIPNSRHNSASVAIIGAGASGLAAAKEMKQEGHRVTIYEKGSRIGGVWAYSPEVEDDPLGLVPSKRIHSSIYASLRTNLPRELMGYTDYPFDDSFPGSADPRQFPHHQEVLNYLEAYTDHYKLRQHIVPSTTVESIQPILLENTSDSDSSWYRWKLTLSRSDNNNTRKEEEEYDAVVVCNGMYSDTYVPEWPGQDLFQGHQIHSHNYRTPEPFIGHTVLIVGAAASGVDISHELKAAGAARVIVSDRNYRSSSTDESSEQEYSKTQQIAKVGNIVSFGPGKRVTFVGGIEIDPIDTVIYCTGYRYNFPFLKGTPAYPGVDDNRVQGLYQHLFLPQYAPTLSFIGLCWKVVPMLRAQLQAKLVARYLSKRCSLPSREHMEQEAAAFYTSLDDAGVMKRHTHRHAGEIQWDYNKWLIQECGDVEQLPEWRSALYNATSKARVLYGIDGYRDRALPGVEDFEAAAHGEFERLRAIVDEIEAS